MAEDVDQFKPPDIAFEDNPDLRQTNETDKRLWQRRCTWVRTCARCGQYHGQLHDQSAGVASIPVHINCQCVDNIIEPGETTRGYPTHDTIIQEASPGQQQRYMGKGNFDLWQNGSVKFEDVVSKRSIRPLHVVTSRIPQPVDLLKGVPTDKRVEVLADWYKDVHGLSGGLETRAAVARLNFTDMASVVRREFDSIIQDFAVPEAELRDLFGKELGREIFRGEAVLRVEVGSLLGSEVGGRYLAGELSVDQARAAAIEAGEVL
jgi:hypothetical protein